MIVRLPWICGLGVLLAATGGPAADFPLPLAMSADGKLEYLVDDDGNRVPDFSHAGYGGGGVPLPEVAARVQVRPAEGDDGARIQAALDHVAALPPDAAGLRGAVQLASGRFEIEGQLKIRASGVVLRGAGSGGEGTTLVATGTSRRTLIEVGDHDVRRSFGEALPVTDDHVPVGATRLTLSDTSGLRPGSEVTITRPSPAEWIRFVGMDLAPGRQPYSWKAGTQDVYWDRVITTIDGNVVTLDAPLTVALEQRFGGAVVRNCADEGWISRCGVEQLRCVSAFDPSNPLDENHAWNAIDLHALRDGWVVDVTVKHFAGSAVMAGETASRISVQDCTSLAPVSEPGGHRRMAFHSRGQQMLFLRCISGQGRNDFTAGHHSAGPVVFLDCEARESGGFSGSSGSWASGLLFDGVSIDGGMLRLDHLENYNQGAGWAAANSMLWQCSAGAIICRAPPGAMNWAVGVWGQMTGNGHWSSTHAFTQPDSLFRAQLAARLGDPALDSLKPRPHVSPTRGLKEIPPQVSGPAPPGKPLALVNGRLMVGGKLLSGGQIETAWWRGRLEPARAAEAGPALTRFVPGRSGTGLTDDLAAVADEMIRKGEVVFRHHPGLWYDRRRDDHQMIRRPDNEVWPPFFEQPFGRSGRSSAWHGLSRYDLTKYNPWYFGRLREFAALARERGLVLMNSMYFQHNLLESGAHWVDSPWRTENNVNKTGFTEPPPFEGDTIRMAGEFYDTTHPLRRELHRAYIRHHLDELAGETNVIHNLTAENSGPLHFMRFWLDVIAEWERETGGSPLIALSAPKDVQDAILADPARAAVVDVIDFSYWYRTEDGREFAPPGGVTKSPRQQGAGRGGPSPASASQMAEEYRREHPGKAISTGYPGAGDFQPR